MSDNKEIVIQAYDEVPYQSYAIHQTSPAYMRSCAFIFGVDAPDPHNARVLELGCATGNNIITIAATYPKSECVGVDISPSQIEEGQKIIDEVGLKNIGLEAKSILEIDESCGKFDYIICHGVFSWVTKEVQEKILEICNKNLSPNGVAYISYNTLPGWSAPNAVRQMMKFHTTSITDPIQKATQARWLLSFIKDSHKNFPKNFYTEIIESEIEMIKDESDWYLMHEYLEESNIQLYFYDFMVMAKNAGLQYLCEADLATMTTDRFSQETRKILSSAGNIIRMEQYLDFISNRRFRATLLCHQGSSINRNINPERIKDKFFTSRFTLPEELKDYDYNSGGNLTFTLPNGMNTTTNNMVMILAFETLAEQKNKPVSLQKILSEISRKAKQYKIPGQPNEEAISQILLPNLLNSVFAGGIFLHHDEGEFVTEISPTPEVFNLARYMAQHYNWMPTLNQKIDAVDAVDRILIPLLNGSNFVDAIVDFILDKIQKGELENIKMPYDNSARENISKLITHKINSYASKALLVR